MGSWWEGNIWIFGPWKTRWSYNLMVVSEVNCCVDCWNRQIHHKYTLSGVNVVFCFYCNYLWMLCVKTPHSWATVEERLVNMSSCIWFWTVYIMSKHCKCDLLICTNQMASFDERELVVTFHRNSLSGWCKGHYKFCFFVSHDSAVWLLLKHPKCHPKCH